MKSESHHTGPVIDDPAVDQSSEELLTNDIGQQEQGSFLELLMQLAEWKFFIVKFVFCSAVLAAIVAFIWPKSFTSTTKIMPAQQGQSSISSALMGQIGPLASLAGSSLGVNKTTSDVYVYILRSRTVADHLVDRFSLMSVYRDKKRVDAVDDLREYSQINAGPEGGISISVSDRDPQRAADIANAYVDELRKLNQTLAVTEAGRRRVFFEREVEQSTDELSRAEMAMKKTQEQTGILMLEPQSKALLENLAGLHAQISVKAAEVQAMRSFATDVNPDLKRAQSELGAMKSELNRIESGTQGSTLADFNLRKIPEKGLEYVRALRELKYHEAVYEAMIKEYEIARVDEAKDAAIIQVLDAALPAEVRSSPKRSLIVFIASLLALFLAVAFVLAAERAKTDGLTLARLHVIKLRLLQRAEK
jgi:uncharacterized protein involved in exopolysaccharide biosynthesis